MNIRAKMLQRLHVYASGAYVHTKICDEDLQIQISSSNASSESLLSDSELVIVAAAPQLPGEVDKRLKAEIQELEGKIDALLKKHRQMVEVSTRTSKK